LKKISKRL